MKYIFFTIALLFQVNAISQKNVGVTFVNEYADVYHLALIIYMPDGKSETRVSDLQPYAKKSYTYPIGSEIYIATPKQEKAAMKGSDPKSRGLKPYLILEPKDEEVTILLSTVNNK